MKNNLRHITTAFANAKLLTPFEWGQNDCNTLALEFIDIMLPNIPSITKDVQGKYSNRYEARKFYRDFKWRWSDYLLSLGFEKVEPLFFQPGDLHIHKMGKSLEAVSISLGLENIIADPKHDIRLINFFQLYDKYEFSAYRLMR